jgi:hypothetical protein
MGVPLTSHCAHPFDVCDLHRLCAEDILPRHAYARCRRTWLAQMRGYLRQRRIRLSATASLLFENAVTVRHQVQEVLYWETPDDETAAARIREELDTYRTLLPTSQGLGATLLLDGGSARAGAHIGEALAAGRYCIGLVTAGTMIPARLADTDPNPAEPVKFLRFDLDRAQRRAMLSGVPLSVWGADGDGPTMRRLDPHTALSLAEDIRGHRAYDRIDSAALVPAA